MDMYQKVALYRDIRDLSQQRFFLCTDLVQMKFADAFIRMNIQSFRQVLENVRKTGPVS